MRSRLRTSLDEDALEPTGTTDIAGTETSPSSGSSSLDSPPGVDLIIQGGESLTPCRMHLLHTRPGSRMLTHRALSCGLGKLVLQPVLETGALAALELQPPAMPGQRKSPWPPLAE